MNPEMKIVVQEILHVHPVLKNVVQEMLLIVQQMLLAKLRKRSKLDKDVKRKEVVLFMMNKCMKKLDQKHEKNQNPDRLYLLVKKIRHSGPSSGSIPTKMLKRLFNLENEVGNKNEAYSRPTDKVEAFKFEKKVYSEQYEFNQKVAEQ